MACTPLVFPQGLAFYWGTSEWSAAEILQASGIADRLGLHRPVMEQVRGRVAWRARQWGGTAREGAGVRRQGGFGDHTHK